MLAKLLAIQPFPGFSSIIKSNNSFYHYLLYRHTYFVADRKYTRFNNLFTGKGDLVGCDISQHLAACSNGQGGSNQHGSNQHGGQDVIVKSSSDVKVIHIYIYFTQLHGIKTKRIYEVGWTKNIYNIYAKFSVSAPKKHSS